MTDSRIGGVLRQLESWKSVDQIAADGPEVLLNAMSFVEHHFCTSEGIHQDHTTGFLASTSLVAVSFSYEAFLRRVDGRVRMRVCRFQFQTALMWTCDGENLRCGGARAVKCGRADDTHRPSSIRRIVEGRAPRHQSGVPV